MSKLRDANPRQPLQSLTSAPDAPNARDLHPVVDDTDSEASEVRARTVPRTRDGLRAEAVPGWTTERPATEEGYTTAAEHLIEILQAAGVAHAFGIVGGGIAPFCDALLRSSIPLWHTRHEAGAAFCAAEAFFATGSPAAVFVTTGPGLTNALTGLAAARWDGAKVVLISGGTAPSHRGRWGVQETSPFTMPAELFEAGRLFDFGQSISDPAELPEVARRLAVGFARRAGFVAHLSLPLNVQTTRVPRARVKSVQQYAAAGCDRQVVTDCAQRLRSGPVAIWVGYGARSASAEVRALAERLGAAVMCSPRAKGIFPEEHPQFVGVTGAGGHEQVERYLGSRRPLHTLVLGTRLGEVTSFWAQALTPSEAFIHVDLDPEVFGAAYPAARTIGVQAEVGELARALLSELAEAELTTPEPAATAQSIAPLGRPAELASRPTPRVRPQYLMQTLQRVVVDETSATVMTESGNAFGWGNNLLRFSSSGRYRTSAAFGAMGHFVTGVVGAALVRDAKAVAVVGDGAMLMNNEISTAVKYGAQAVWVVLNDGLYGITHQAMPAQGFAPVETVLPDTDFVQFARSMGADGIRVSREDDLERAMRVAMAHDGPFVLDVQIDASEVSPVLKRRIESLEKQRELQTAKAGGKS